MKFFHLLILVGSFSSQNLVSGEVCDVHNKNARFDCHPDPNPTQATCLSRGCCWQPHNSNIAEGNIDVPYCYFPHDRISYNVTSLDETAYGYRATLTLESPTGFPEEIRSLTADFWLENAKRFHFKIYDSSKSRYEVPIETPAPPQFKAQNVDYNVKFSRMPFGVSVTRKTTGAKLFDCTLPGAPLVFANQFIQITTLTETGLIYGLGEHRARLLHNASAAWQQYVMWSRDLAPQDNSNLYGVHPFFLNVEKDGKTHGVFLLNSNAMEVDLQPYPAVTFRTIGGIIDMYIFVGPTAREVVEQYTAVVGRTYMPPYWSLGFHLCRYNYNSVEKLKMVIERNRKLGIPYDVQWSDIDYMDRHLDWTYDKSGAYPTLADVVEDLHNHSQKYVVIVDPGISNEYPGKYAPYDAGMKEGVFIRDASGAPLIGKVWPGTTVFPDFTNPKTADWWYEQANAFHSQIPFDGLWTDMNEPSNFVSGSTTGCTKNNLDNPPFVPHVVGGSLQSSTVCPSAVQYLHSHYNLHSLYGLTEANATHSALRRILGKRSLVISRSSYPSQGRYGGHWSGDIYSVWDDLSHSIPAILEFQMFGIPLVGADVCGFQHDTTEELCIRWMQLGAFYPFFRNHNDDTSRDQDPAAFSPSAQLIMKSVVEMRYLLLPFMYTQFYYSHVNGTPVIQPLFFEYPGDEQTYGIDTQFLWGSALLISPVLQQGQVTVNAYFPADLWYDIYGSNPVIDSNGKWQTLKAPLDTINLHVRGGHILPFQQPEVTTALARKNPFGLIVAFNRENTARGSLYWDDGESLGTLESGQYDLIHFEASKGSLKTNVAVSGYQPQPGLILDVLLVWGVGEQPSTATVNGQSALISYTPALQLLIIESFQADLLQPITVSWH